MWYIRDLPIENEIVIAPMAGISNAAFRSLYKEFGAGFIVSELISDKAIFYKNEKTMGMLDVHENEHPMALQLFGHDIDTMVHAAKVMDQDTACDVIDINMGCPVNKVVKSFAGSALMKDPEHAYKLVKAIVAAVKKPVTVKFRAGWDAHSINAVEFAKLMEKAGASAICIHGRTRAQMYEGKADWSIIKQVKDAVSIPVMGNGDVKSVADFKAMMEETGCDAVAIGRGVLGNPWLIRQCNHYLKTGEILEDVSYQEKFALAFQHARNLCELKGERVGMKEMRGHATWYIKGLPKSHVTKDRLSKVETFAEFEDILHEYELILQEYEDTKPR
ncbi:MULTISPECIES: tRNA dihydrouridine synthase DusB [unclassified Breznakia]|uniref:tRNA dihydrouridine synthase DusB n=1 Tax=unclassified Breznakia TaxID=2623764 RepID=UPI0024766A7F|nr:MULTISPECIES: tRNA dihydrouridine synthase DusB [unclassified Breznakia]MDH6366985.1 nifR3 family TIM-barrel protein [Breznakia sp. PH1-1]MDH6404243.1 nifR3 family TIM-barrel protein [Breznakia sp. PF1-11]MDH6411872.1 nifR3 family TIM-barrel protein [Breznakia sp. PFB1-11]MDH6414231.1 nifR3 family TIM-barrel protein [Breznakia sp. PFB1-14]MDH6415945.1 nifR3 family TIM-barrel protein [Breznakia sp. PFB1-4]